MTSTAVGYSGGKTKNPTYMQVCYNRTGHAEVVRVEYDPKKVSYDRLLEVFFGVHNPTQFGGQGVNIGDQYRSVVFYHSEEQLSAVTAWRDKLEKSKGKKLATQIVKAPAFYMAESYHQQYYVRTGVKACPIPPKSGGSE